MELVLGNIYDSYDVECLVKQIHHTKEDFYEGNLIERINKFGFYKLVEIEVDKLATGMYVIDDSLVDDFLELNDSTMPPIVLGELLGGVKKGKYDVIDGNHRVETAVRKKMSKILAFLPVGEE